MQAKTAHTETDYSRNKGTFIFMNFFNGPYSNDFSNFKDGMSRGDSKEDVKLLQLHQARELRYYKPGLGLIPFLTISWWNHSRAKVISAVLGENSVHISFSVNLWMSIKPTTPGSPPALNTGVTTSASARFLDNSTTLKMSDNRSSMVKWTVASINVYTRTDSATDRNNVTSSL